MSTRLEQFISAENLSQSQFADTIGVARASVSHILSGRNKPGFDFIESMARHFPALNLDWLITGKGKMYKNGQLPVNVPAASREMHSDDLFAMDTDEEETTAPEPAPVIPEPENKPRKQPERTEPKDNPVIALQCASRVSKIIIFYEDNTFQELK